MKPLHLVIAAALAPAACSDPDPPAPAEPGPVVLIGADGLEWSVLSPLLAEGRLPTLQRLIEHGTSGRLYTLKPSFSPSIWTSVATGKRPEEHGIQGFLGRDGQPYTSRSRRVSALWNIASAYDREVLSVGWWVTWPAERVRGRMVAPYSAAGQDQMLWKGNLHPPGELPDQTWPSALIDELHPLVAAAPDALLQRRRHVFAGADAAVLSPTERRLVDQTAWSLGADDAFLIAALHLLRRRPPPDLTLVYFGAPDVASHRFWAYRHPEEFAFALDPSARAALAPAIDAFYVDLDRKVGELVAALPGDANVVLVSDHGFHAFSTAQPSPLGITGHHLDGPPGVAILCGPAFRSGHGAQAALGRGGELPDVGRVYEVTPLILYLLGIPAGADMEAPDGGALLRQAVRPERLREQPPLPPVASHDDAFTPAEAPAPEAPEAAAAVRTWMEQLGYLDGADPDTLFVEVLPTPNRAR